MKKLHLLIIAALMLTTALSCTRRTHAEADYDNVIPHPASITLDGGPGFTLTPSTRIACTPGDTALLTNAGHLAGYLAGLTGIRPEITTDTAATDIILLTAELPDSNREAYTIVTTPERIVIDGASAAGNFYGIQTLRKSIPAAGQLEVTFPAATIADAPRFAYRGAHFDVARHFFPVDTVKKFIDMLALHNINTFHWHLTDDQGWRIEIKKYPELTTVGSIRKGTCIRKDFESSDSIPYGGFFTQDEARDIVRYAADRHITVIPEIDLPGHMVAALTAYPHLGCTGGPYEVWQRWGVSDDVLCAGNDSTYTFIGDVLREIADIFPSEYIHVGGDECPKGRWEECPRCQAKIKELGLVSDSHSTKEQKLQSYVMERASDYLASMGRKMIGWDEIMEGGLTPGAVVMSWRGTEGGLQAASLGHDAIMTPMSYCYLNFHQSADVDNEPFGIGGYVPLENVYGYEPVPSGFTPEQAAHIKGVQANLWTEYIHTFDHALYMELPRLAALSEVQWCAPDTKDFDAFRQRLPQLMAHYDHEGYNYARHLFDVTSTVEPDPEAGNIRVTLSTFDNAPVYYTLDGSEPTEASALYEGPFTVDRSADLKAVAIRDGKKSRVNSERIILSKATFRPVTLKDEPAPAYKGNGGATLTDGLFGTTAFNTPQWLGFIGSPLCATIDLGESTEISSVQINNLVDTGNWIFDLALFQIEVSDDGENFSTVSSQNLDPAEGNVNTITTHTATFPKEKARYVRVTAKPVEQIPSWHEGKGKPAFIFVDEIIID